MALILLTMLLGTAAVATLLYNNQLKHEEATTDAIARAAMRDLQSDIFELERYVSRISNVFQASPNMSRQTFWRLMRQPIRDVKTVQHISWAQMVRAQSLNSWIAEQKEIKKELLTYQAIRALRELQPLFYKGPDNWQTNSQALQEDNYKTVFIQSMIAPILFIEDEMGKVLNSAPHFRQPIELATQSGEITATQSKQNSKGKLRSLLQSPIYKEQISPGNRKDLRRERQKQIAGMLNFKIDTAMLVQNRFAETVKKGLDISVSELAESGEQTRLFSSNDAIEQKHTSQTEEVNFFGNQWQIAVHRERAAFSVLLPSALASAVGLLMMAALLLWHVSNHRFRRELHLKLEQQKNEISNKTHLLEAVLAAAPVGIEYIDENNVVQLQNDLSQIGGSTGESAREAISNGSAQPSKQSRDKKHNLEHYNLNINDNGQNKYFELIAKEITKETEDCLGALKLGSIIVCSDVTEREINNLKLARYVHELEQAHKELEQFTYSATHDMQEPLRRIASFSEILSEQIANGEFADSVELSAKLVSSSTDMRQRYARVVDEINNRNRLRAEKAHLLEVQNMAASDQESGNKNGHG